MRRWGRGVAACSDSMCMCVCARIVLCWVLVMYRNLNVLLRCDVNEEKGANRASV